MRALNAMSLSRLGVDFKCDVFFRSADTYWPKSMIFFFQAEDGIRDVAVTGVQTCALPIFTRAEYLETIQKPILKTLEDSKLWAWQPGTNGSRRLASSKIKYLLLCYHVPTKFFADTNLVEKGTENARPELRRTEASVDSQLACLPLVHHDLRFAGAINNHAFGATNSAVLHPTNSILLVTRLDGPSPEIAARLIDGAITAETNGLWGRAYIDTRGLSSGPYQKGDDWLRTTAELARGWGFETDVDAD